MKTANIGKLVLAVVFTFAAQTARANTELADVMGLLGDQFGELNTFSRSVAKDVQPKVFAKVQSRCRAAVILFGLIESKKGSLNANGFLVADVFTPTMMGTLEVHALRDALDKFSALLKKASDQFTLVEAEVAAQAALADATTRDFTTVKALIADVGTTMREAHKIFRPAP